MNDPGQKLAIGIDIGATNTKIGLVDASGSLLAHQVIASNLKAPSPQPFLEQAYAIVAGYLEKQAVSGIGIALCSLVNEAHTGSFLSVNAPALDGLDIQAAFAQRFGLPVRVINDVAAHALAEYHFGAGGGVRRLLVLALGTGLCIAMLYDGSFVENWGGVTADAARVILDPASPYTCQAGVRGSAEALLGTATIEAEAAAQSGIPGRSAHEIIASARRGTIPSPAGCWRGWERMPGTCWPCLARSSSRSASWSPAAPLKPVMLYSTLCASASRS